LAPYVLLAIVLVTRKGRTLGPWLFELEVVDVATGGKPRLGRAAIRVVLPIALPLAGSLIEYVLGLYGYEFDTVLDVGFGITWLVPPLALLWASLRSVGKQTPWDKLSRTMVRYRTRRNPAI